MAQLSPGVRITIFYGIFGLLFITYGLIVAGANIAPANVFGSGLATFVTMAPLALERVPAELIPAILGGALAWTAPLRATNVRTVLLMALSALVWLAYLHAQVIFQGNDTVEAIGLTAYSGNLIAAQNLLENFASSIRNFAAVIFAATIGLRLNDAMPGAAPSAVPEAPQDQIVAEQTPLNVGQAVPQRQEPDDVPDPALGQGKG